MKDIMQFTSAFCLSALMTVPVTVGTITAPSAQSNYKARIKFTLVSLIVYGVVEGVETVKLGEHASNPIYLVRKYGVNVYVHITRSRL